MANPPVSCVQDPPGARVDVHVLAYLGHSEWLAQTLASLADAPCRVWLVDGGWPDHIGQGRAYAFGFGAAEYVSFLDDDDNALPGALAACVAHLDAHPGDVGVYTDLERLHPDGLREVVEKPPWDPIRQLTSPNEITHLKVMRRALVMRHLDELRQWPTWEEFVLCGLLAADGHWHHLPIVGAVKRARPAAESSQRLTTPGLLEQAVRRIAPGLMAARRES
jgi:hypothetical protein